MIKLVIVIGITLSILFVVGYLAACAVEKKWLTFREFWGSDD